MKIILAKIFRLLFKFKFFKKRYFGIHQKVFKPFNLFKDVILITKWNDLKMSLHINDWIQGNLYFLGHYEKAELKSIDQFLKHDSIFIDIGANIGLYTLYASKSINENGQIISFEPYSQTFKSLVKNVSLNEPSNILLEKMAIGEKNGFIDLYYNENEKNLGMVSATSLKGHQQEKVKVISLDSYLKNKSFKKIDLIKIDIEGFEYSALLGMKNTLKSFYPTLLIEILNNNQSNSNISKCENLLKEIGYNKYLIDDYGQLSINEINTDRKNYIYSIKNIC